MALSCYVAYSLCSASSYNMPSLCYDVGSRLKRLWNSLFIPVCVIASFILFTKIAISFSSHLQNVLLMMFD